MNPIIITKPRPLRSKLPWVISCVLILSLHLPARAQSATNFNVPAPAVQASTEEAPAAIAPAASTPAKQFDITKLPASRHIGEEELPAYLEALGSALTIRTRATDPFGLLQDPDAKPVIKAAVAQTRRHVPMQATPFSDIIRLIKVTTVMPSERKFLVGTRSIRQGDRIPLSFRGRNIIVEVASVSSRAIEFRNIENNETAALQLNLLPAGMTPGNDGITAPGMVADRPDAPLDLDGNSLPLDASHNR